MTFCTYASRIKTGKSLYCSKLCTYADRKGKPILHLKVFEKGRTQGKNEKNPNWKGDMVSKQGLHAWLVRHYGRPQRCERCNTQEAKRYDWANISGEYKRDRDDFIRLCRSCHVSMDKNWKKKADTFYPIYKPKKEKSCIKCSAVYFNKNSESQYCSKDCWYRRNK